MQQKQKLKAVRDVNENQRWTDQPYSSAKITQKMHFRRRQRTVVCASRHLTMPSSNSHHKPTVHTPKSLPPCNVFNDFTPTLA